jgi:hypothetical protein
MTDLTLIDVPVEPERAYGFSPVTLYSPEVPTRRIFADSVLQAEVDRVLAGLPGDRSAAELEVGADAEGVQLVVAVKLSAGWSLRGGVSWSPGGTWGGKVAIRWAGK